MLCWIRQSHTITIFRIPPEEEEGEGKMFSTFLPHCYHVYRPWIWNHIFILSTNQKYHTKPNFIHKFCSCYFQSHWVLFFLLFHPITNCQLHADNHHFYFVYLKTLKLFSQVKIVNSRENCCILWKFNLHKNYSNFIRRKFPRLQLCLYWKTLRS